MTDSSLSWFARLGFLRLALVALAFINVLIPLIDSLLIAGDAPIDEHSLWHIIVTYVTPVMAPLLVVVILFDYIMSRVRAADAETNEQRSHYVSVGRLELAVIVITLLFWIPFFTRLMR